MANDGMNKNNRKKVTELAKHVDICRCAHQKLNLASDYESFEVY